MNTWTQTWPGFNTQICPDQVLDIHILISTLLESKTEPKLK
jgi:hypothetical protein